MHLLHRLRPVLETRPMLADGILAIVLFSLTLLTNWAMRSMGGQEWSVSLIALSALMTLPLVWRRRFPVAVLAFVIMAYSVFQLADLRDDEWLINAIWVALYTAGAYGQTGRNLVRAGSVAIIYAFVVFNLFFNDSTGMHADSILVKLLTLAANVVIIGGIWWFGDAVRIRRERESDLALNVRQLEHERGENARRAVFEERVRIARELHDVVAHNVSVMGIQAGAARRMLTRSPEQAAQALSAIETTSRTAVLELHRMLGLLRPGTETAGLAPQPGLNQLNDLVANMREAGLVVEVEVQGEVWPLAPGVDLSAYRIIQEALTNVLKHAGRAKVAVVIRYVADAVDIEIDDDGYGPRSHDRPTEGGRGLIGMRERVSLLNGTLTAGHQPGVGFSVRAHLPFGASTA